MRVTDGEEQNVQSISDENRNQVDRFQAATVENEGKVSVSVSVALTEETVPLCGERTNREERVLTMIPP